MSGIGSVTRWVGDFATWRNSTGVTMRMTGPTSDLEIYYVCRACGLERREAFRFCGADMVEREADARGEAIDAAIVWLREKGHTMPPEGEESLEFIAYVNGAHAGRFYRAPMPLEHDWEARERVGRAKVLP